MHAGEVHELEACAVSEVASFGAFVADASGEILMNEAAGFGARTRPGDATHALAASLGYGALSCIEAEGAVEAEVSGAAC